jgi:hypothetical protein
MDIYKQPNILHLKGVFESDICFDELIFETKFTEVFNSTTGVVSRAPEKKYDQVPTKYTGYKNHPKTTNLHCWNCDNTFSTVPYFMVDDTVMKPNNEEESDISGNFCSENCTQAHIDKYFTGSNHQDKTKYLTKTVREFTCRDVIIIKPSYEKTIQKKYCGERGVSTEDYIKMNRELISDYSLGSYKMEQFRESVV